VQVEQEDPTLLKPAIDGMNLVVRDEPRNPAAWRLLGIAYGRDGQLGMAALSLAQSAAEAGRAREAKRQAQQALRQLPYGSPAWLRAQDIVTTSKSDDKGGDSAIGD
jgi:predicted Zn-dependent protease